MTKKDGIQPQKITPTDIGNLSRTIKDEPKEAFIDKIMDKARTAERRQSKEREKERNRDHERER